MKTKRKYLGKLGEDIASDILQKRGYRILARNYRNRFGEIDLIAVDGDTLVFVEVKLRTSLRFGLPEEAVDKRKIEKIKSIGIKFWQDNYPHLKKLRIDVVSIMMSGDKIQGKIIKLA